MPLFSQFLRHTFQAGSLEVEMACGRRHRVGDGSGRSVAVRFADRAAVRKLLLNPELALGELYVVGRLILTRGTIYDLLAIIGRNLSTMTPPGLGRAREGLRRALYDYLAASEVGFRFGGLMVFQIQLAKRQDAVPLTRAYIEASESELMRLKPSMQETRIAAG